MNQTFDLVIIGAGEAGQAAAHLARGLGGSVVIKTRTPIHVLAVTIHPFPTTVRVLGGLFDQAAGRLRVRTESEA